VGGVEGVVAEVGFYCVLMERDYVRFLISGRLLPIY